MSTLDVSGMMSADDVAEVVLFVLTRPRNHRILETAFTQTLNLSRKRNLSMRMAALSLGVERVAKEKARRGLYP